MNCGLKGECKMTDKQTELLSKLGQTFAEIADECTKDEEFHQILTDNNDLFPMSLDELAYEFFVVAEGIRISPSMQEEIFRKLLLSAEHEIVKVGKHQIFKEDNLYVVEKFEFEENGKDQFSVHDGYKTMEEALKNALML